MAFWSLLQGVNGRLRESESVDSKERMMARWQWQCADQSMSSIEESSRLNDIFEKRMKRADQEEEHRFILYCP